MMRVELLLLVHNNPSRDGSGSGIGIVDLPPQLNLDWAEKVGRQDTADQVADWRRRLEEGKTGGEVRRAMPH